MPTKIEPKVVDLEAELSGAQGMYQVLAPNCSVAKRAAGIPQLAPQEKQMSILKYEMEETLLCINLASKGQHAVRDAKVKSCVRKAIVEYERLEEKLRDGRWQLVELDCLNYFAQKNIIDLLKQIPSQADELAMVENAYNRLRLMENRLDLVTKRFCMVNSENKKLREEIIRLLIERHNFNVQWRRMITKLLHGKEYLVDIFEVATEVFANREEWSKNLDTLKWKGLFGLNKDINDMQLYDGELNYLAKLEEFLRVKGTKRICEADVKAKMMRDKEYARCEQQIAEYDDLLDKIFSFAGSSGVAAISKNFIANEANNQSLYVLLCEVLQQSIVLKKEVTYIRQRTKDQAEINEGRRETQARRLAELRVQLGGLRQRTQHMKELNKVADVTILNVMNGINDIVRLAQCNLTPLLSLLGNHKQVTKWNVHKFLYILELEIKNIIQVVYGAVKPPAVITKPTHHRKPAAEQPHKKLVADPRVEMLRPKRIETLVPYQPCAYCVEDYIMNMVFETPAVPADKEFINQIFHLQEVNTKFGIFTLTVPEKRHASRDKHRE